MTQQFRWFLEFQQEVYSLRYNGGGGVTIVQPLPQEDLEAADDGRTVFLDAMERGHVLVLIQDTLCFAVRP